MATCRYESFVDAHFAGDHSPSRERELRAHLPECASCTARYQRQLLLQSLDPKALTPEERLARGLGLRKRRVWLAPATVSLGVAFAVLAIFMWPREDGFVARGTRREPGVRIYRIDARPIPVEGSIARKDELAFAYRNPGKKKRLLVFAVDEHRHVYWYHPAWQNAAETPTAVPIEPGPEWRELPDAIAHPLDGNQLTLHAVFTDDPLDVRTVENRLQKGEPLGQEVVIPLRVTR